MSSKLDELDESLLETSPIKTASKSYSSGTVAEGDDPAATVDRDSYLGHQSSDAASMGDGAKDAPVKPSALSILLASTRQQKLALLTLALVNLMGVMCMSIMAPFFPKEVRDDFQIIVD